MSQLHNIVHKIFQNPAQAGTILAEMAAGSAASLTAEEASALNLVLQNGTVTANLFAAQSANNKGANILNLWVRPEE